VGPILYKATAFRKHVVHIRHVAKQTCRATLPLGQLRCGIEASAGNRTSAHQKTSRRKDSVIRRQCILLIRGSPWQWVCNQRTHERQAKPKVSITPLSPQPLPQRALPASIVQSSARQERGSPPGNPKPGTCVAEVGGPDDTKPGTIATAPMTGTATAPSLPELRRFFFPPRLTRETPPPASIGPLASADAPAESPGPSCGMSSPRAKAIPAAVAPAPTLLRGTIPEPRLCSGCKNLQSLPSLHQPLDFQCRHTMTLFSAPGPGGASAGVVLRIALGLPAALAATSASITAGFGVPAVCVLLDAAGLCRSSSNPACRSCGCGCGCGCGCNCGCCCWGDACPNVAT